MVNNAAAGLADTMMTCFPRAIRYPGYIPSHTIRNVDKLNIRPEDSELQIRVRENMEELLTSPISRADAQQKRYMRGLLRNPTINLGRDLHIRDIELDNRGFPFTWVMECNTMNPSTGMRGDGKADGFL